MYIKEKLQVEKSEADKYRAYLKEPGLMFSERGNEMIVLVVWYPYQTQMQIQIHPRQENPAYVQAVLINEYGKELLVGEEETELFCKFMFSNGTDTYCAQIEEMCE